MQAAALPVAAQVSELPPLTIKPEDQAKISSRLSVLVNDFAFSGNTVFTAKQLLDAPVITHMQAGTSITDKRVSDFRGAKCPLMSLNRFASG